MAERGEYEGDTTYTRKKIRQQLELIQEHSSDGSAWQGCTCIPKKHLELLSAYAAEGMAIAADPKEKELYFWLGPWADRVHGYIEDVLDMNDDSIEKTMWKNLADDTREIRKEIEPGQFNIPNPASKRQYLPHGLTVEEKSSKALQHKLSSCINQVEQKCCDGHTTILYHDGKADYSQCTCNPVAVCRAQLEA